MSPRILLIPAFLLLAQAAVAQDKNPDTPTPGDVMIEKYLAAETDKLSRKFMDGATTLAQWQEKRPRLHREYLDMLGLWPLPEKTPLKATVTGQLEAHGVIVEKLHFQSKPGLYVTANFYRPRARDGKRLPTILYVCGHSGRGRDGNKSAYQDQGFWFANHGYTCLILDTLQLGEIRGVHHGTYGLRGTGAAQAPTRFWWHSAGYTPAGVECWNGIRAIDYLVTRPEVDPQRIGVTGISGGGAATFWIAAADDRVRVAVPVSGMSDLESYVKNKVINGHCDCMFLYNTYQWDWTTIAALVAPRPMLFANSDNDPIFPMDGNRRIIAKLRACYKLHGTPELVDEYVSKGNHAYRPDLRMAAFAFLNKHLKGDRTAPIEDSAQYKELPGKDLRVFPTDADVPKDALNAKIDETFVPRAQVKLPEKGMFAEWKKGMLAQLRERSFLYLPSEFKKATRNNVTIESEPGVPFRTFSQSPSGGAADGLFIPRLDKKPLPPRKDTLFRPEDFGDANDQLLSRYVWQDAHYWGIVVRGISDGSWTQKSPPNYVERSMALLGRTVDAGRVWDVAGAARYFSDRDKRPLKLLGVTQGSVIAAYAALLEPSIKEVILINPPKSHKEGPHFLGVLRVLDIPDALGLLAPTPLTIVGGNDPAFDRTAEIYRLAGAADKLTRK